jgi:hypothetical protein
MRRCVRHDAARAEAVGGSGAVHEAQELLFGVWEPGAWCAICVAGHFLLGPLCCVISMLVVLLRANPRGKSFPAVCVLCRSRLVFSLACCVLVCLCCSSARPRRPPPCSSRWNHWRSFVGPLITMCGVVALGLAIDEFPNRANAQEDNGWPFVCGGICSQFPSVHSESLGLAESMVLDSRMSRFLSRRTARRRRIQTASLAVNGVM